MSWRLRNRLVGYDNIAVGSAKGREMIVVGSSDLAKTTMYGGGETLKTSGDSTPGYSTDFGIENLVGGASADTSQPPDENIG